MVWLLGSWLIGFVCSVLTWKKTPKLANIDRLATALVPVSVVFVIEQFILRILNAPLEEWNFLRLVAPFALVSGQRLYYPAGDGPLISGLNAPFQPLSFLPATLASTPTTAVYLGTLTAGCLALVPLVLSIVWGQGKKQSKVFSILGASLALCLIFRSPSLRLSSFLIHADAPALGFACLSGLALFLKLKSRTKVYLVSAILAVIASYSKITLSPILVALPLYLWITEGLRAALRYFIVLMSTLIAITTGLFLIFGSSALIFNVQSSVQSDWVANLYRAEGYAVGNFAKIKVLFAALNEVVQGYYFLMALALGFLGVQFQKGNLRKPSLTTLSIIFSVLLLPGSLMGRVKAGGALNTLSPTLYFLVLATPLALLELIRNTSDSKIKTFLSTGMLSLLIVVGLASVPDFYELWWPLKNVHNNVHEQAYKYAKRHPGTTYFPNQPLSSLLAEGKVYHSEYLIFQYMQSPYKLSQKHFERYTPESMQQVAFTSSDPSAILEYLKEFKTKTTDPELPGWTIYRR